MIRQFFLLAMTAPNRQSTFRRAVVAHVIFLALASLLTFTDIIAGITSATSMLAGVAAKDSAQGRIVFGYILVALAMIEAAVLISWRLSQIPKSQALEFLLVSPMHPWRVFFAEWLTGVTTFALVWLSGLPVFMGLQSCGLIEWRDLWPLAVLPAVWGIAIAMCLLSWVYESVFVRRIGQIIGLLCVLCYLIIGVLAGEHIIQWLKFLPSWLGEFLYDGIIFMHTMNPFGVVRFWFLDESATWLAAERLTWLIAAGIFLTTIMVARSGYRMKHHFQDRHYRPWIDQRPDELSHIGDRPLSWWAVRRVMEYSGRVNLWLAGGFGLIYAAYIVLSDRWPPWMGQLVFQIFEQWGGAAVVATGMAVMASVPAIFQYGLWDHSNEDRSRRLELLLLTDLSGIDYFRASLSAAWTRGRGYLFVAIMLWGAMALGGRIPWHAAVASSLGACVLWMLAFTVGFRAFSTGKPTSVFAMLFVFGWPTLLFGLMKAGQLQLAGLVPVGLCYLPAGGGVNIGWTIGMILSIGFTTRLLNTGLIRCESDLRNWVATH